MKYATVAPLLRERSQSRFQDFCAGFFVGGVIVLLCCLLAGRR